MNETFVYIGEKTDGTLVAHTSLEAMKELDGVKEPLTSFPIADFEAANGLVRLIDGEVVLGLTDKEQESVHRQETITLLKNKLADIDAQAGAGRAFRGVAINSGFMLTALRKAAMDFGDLTQALRKDNESLIDFDAEKNEALKLIVSYNPSENEDLSRIIEWEKKAESVRAELRPLLELENKE